MGRSSKYSSIVAIALGAACWLSLAAPAADASHAQPTYFDATAQLTDPSKRAADFKVLGALGVHALRIMLQWNEVAPNANGSAKPSFDATNPAAYNWSIYLPALEEAKRLHWQVLLTVTSPVPRWATAAHRDGLTRPNAAYFREFMTAAARELGPYVTVWAIWNEPNQLAWLQPQWNRDGSPASPAIYRGLYSAGMAGLNAGGIAHPKVLIGETAPFGESHINARREGTFHQMAPLAFLRGLLCLDSHYRRIGHCAALSAAGFAHHAYPVASGPSYVPPNHDQVTIGTLNRLTKALDLAGRAHAISAGLPIYLTEFGINTLPNPLGVSPLKQAQYDAISEKIAWQNSRVASFGQYQLLDDVVPKHHLSDWTGFQTGLMTASGTRKPLFYSFPVSLVVTRGHHGYSLWGHVRLASGSTSVQVLVRTAPGRRFKSLGNYRTDSLGYWRGKSGAAGIAWKVRWRSPGGEIYEGPALPAS